MTKPIPPTQDTFGQQTMGIAEVAQMIGAPGDTPQPDDEPRDPFPEAQGDEEEPMRVQAPDRPAPESREEGEPIPEDLIAAAQSMGYTPEELQGRTAEDLQQEMSRMDRRLMQLIQQLAPPQLGTPWGTPQQQQQAPPQQQPPQFQSPAPPQQQPPMDWKALEEEYDKGIVAPIKALHDKMAQIDLALQNLRQEQYAQESYELDRWFDEKYSELGEGWNAVYGKGPTHLLNPNSREAQMRAQAKNWFLQLRSMDPVSTDEALRLRAIYSVAPEVFQRETRNQLSKELNKRQRQTIGRPSGSRSHPEVDDRDPQTGLSRSLIEQTQNELNRLIGR